MEALYVRRVNLNKILRDLVMGSRAEKFVGEEFKTQVLSNYLDSVYFPIRRYVATEK